MTLSRNVLVALAWLFSSLPIWYLFIYLLFSLPFVSRRRMQPHDRTSPSHFVNRMREIEIERERKRGVGNMRAGPLDYFQKWRFDTKRGAVAWWKRHGVIHHHHQGRRAGNGSWTELHCQYSFEDDTPFPFGRRRRARDDNMNQLKKKQREEEKLSIF